MALQIPTFTSAGASSGLQGVGSALGGGIGDLIRGVREDKEAQQQQIVRSEATKLSAIVSETDPTRRAALLSTFASEANPKFRGELEQLSQLPFEQQTSIGIASIQEDNFPDLLPQPAPVDESLITIRKEARSGIRKQLASIDKDASALATNFKKLTNLSGEIIKGNRQAVAQGLVALVKIGDPGSTVREGEVVTALNNASPIAALSGLLSNKNTSDDVIRAVTASIDPLNPRNIRIDDFLATANALVGANVPAIQSRFANARESADENLTKAGVKSLFTKGLEKTINDLSVLSPKKESKKVTDLTDEELIKQLGL